MPKQLFYFPCLQKLVVVLLFQFALVAHAQSDHYFKEGLSLNAGSKYGREALYTDLVAHGLYTNSLQQPKEGLSIGINAAGTEMKWTKVMADTAHRFRIRGGAGNYLYFTYQSDKPQVALLTIRGNSAVYVNGELHAGDPYSMGILNIPVRLKHGLNELYVRGQGVVARLSFPNTSVSLNTDDPTVPYIVAGKKNNELKAAVVVINTTAKPLNNLQIRSSLGGISLSSKLPSIPAYSSRKVYFTINGEGAPNKGIHDCQLTLLQSSKAIDRKILKIESAEPTEKYSNTFVSTIDGSLQYYSVAPKKGGQTEGAALFFSVHGAGVEAIGQAKAYQSKDWGNLVTPTNRRPRGFNWEDWGRLDALEVLALAKKEFKPNPQQIYLTGHSMGGHGTWFLGATYPDKWAAIAPCAGYPTLKTYGSADGLIPDSSTSAAGKILLRSSNQSDVPKLAYNYKQLGVYILHGDDDRTVSVEYARQMKRQLAAFHPNFNYYEYPGGSHWYGDHSVDWAPIFDYFKWHTIAADSATNTIDFTTASPGISASNRWIIIMQQQIPLEYSRVQLQRNKDAGTITGKLENVQLLKVNLTDFGTGKTVSFNLDSLNTLSYITKSDADSVFLKKTGNTWAFAEKPSTKEKGPHRYGTFKEGFNHNMVYVYATGGTKEEQEWAASKARYDAESWYYRGNGAVDIITDKEYSKAKYAGRNVILIGNAATNSAWKLLLSDCPIRIAKGIVQAGTQKWTGDDLGAYFVWPIAGTGYNTVSVISGSGLQGMKAVNANQYFAGGSGFADIMIYRLDMLKEGIGKVEYADFYDNTWKVRE